MERSLEELAQIQKEHEEAMEAERQRKEAEEKAERERRAKALEKINQCHSMRKDLETSQKELDSIEETDIQQRINVSEEIKGTVAQKETQLSEMQRDFDDIKGRIDGINKLIEGKKFVAPEIAEELNHAKETQADAKQKIEELAKNLDDLRGKIVTEKEIQKYQDTVEKVYLLNSEIKEIESDPDVSELFAEEIKEKSDMTKLVVDSACDKLVFDKKPIMGIDYKEYMELRKDYVKKIAEQFVKDEIESRQIDAIKNRDTRLDAFKKVGKFLVLGLNNPDLKSVKFSKDNSKVEKSLAYAGLALGHLIGKYPTDDGILNSLGHEISAEEKSSKIEKSHIQDALRIHYKTLNILSAYANEIGKTQFADVIMAHAKNFQPDDIKDKFGDVLVEKEGIIVPKNASKAEKTEAYKLYSAHHSHAGEIKEKIDNFLNMKRMEESEKINSQLLSLKNALRDIESLEKELKEVKISDLNREEEKIKEIISNKEDRLNTARVEYENTLLLNITKRGEISSEIKDLENFIESLIGTRDEIARKKEKWLKIGENLKKLKSEHGSTEDLKNKIAKFEGTLKKLP